MPDLHGWITQQIDETEASTHDTTPGPWTADSYDDTVMAAAGTVARMWDYVRSGSDVQVKADMGLIVTHADPAAVLRRCEAGRRVLARHRLNPDAYWADAAMCDGCGTEGEMGYPRTENLNDCPELLDLGHAYGLTDEILAGLNRPQEGERPEPAGPSLLPDGLAEAMYGNLYAAVIGTRPVEPRPEVKAMEILNPHLKKIPGYIPTAKEQQ